MFTSCNSSLIWLSFVFFVAIHIILPFSFQYFPSIFSISKYYLQILIKLSFVHVYQLQFIFNLTFFCVFRCNTYNSSIFFSIFSMHLFNIKIQSSDFRKSLKTSPSEAFSKDSFKLEASRCFLVSYPSLDSIILTPFSSYQRKMLYYSWFTNNK